MIYLLFVSLLYSVRASPHHHDGHDLSEDKGQDMEVKVSPDSQGGHMGSNNHFSTSKMDDEISDKMTTVSGLHEETIVTTVQTLSETVSDHHKMSVPPEVPTTHKLDAKKDLKKKAKQTPKKKDRNFESSDVATPITDSVEDTTTVESDPNRVVESTTSSFADFSNNMDTTSSVPDSTTMESSSTNMKTATESTTVRLEMLHMGINVESTTVNHAVVEKGSPDLTMPTTTKNENLMSSDEQPPQTTIHDSSEESTTMPSPKEMTMESDGHHTTEQSTTNMPETEPTAISNISDTTDNIEDMSSTDSHFHADIEMTKSNEDQMISTVPPTTPEEESKSDNNSLSNDLEDIQSMTTVIPDDSLESTSFRKQKQMNLEGGCPCNERGTSLDPSECVGGRTAADPNCPCREVCARQSGQSCSPGEPCDEEFGLHCNPQNNTCTGKQRFFSSLQYIY